MLPGVMGIFALAAIDLPLVVKDFRQGCKVDGGEPMVVRVGTGVDGGRNAGDPVTGASTLSCTNAGGARNPGVRPSPELTLLMDVMPWCRGRGRGRGRGDDAGLCCQRIDFSDGHTMGRLSTVSPRGWHGRSATLPCRQLAK